MEMLSCYSFIPSVEPAQTDAEYKRSRCGRKTKLSDELKQKILNHLRLSWSLVYMAVVKWLFPAFGANLYNLFSKSILALSVSKWLRPNMVRLINLVLVFLPSTGPFVYSRNIIEFCIAG